MESEGEKNKEGCIKYKLIKNIATIPVVFVIYVQPGMIPTPTPPPPTNNIKKRGRYSGMKVVKKPMMNAHGKITVQKNQKAQLDKDIYPRTKRYVGKKGINTTAKQANRACQIGKCLPLSESRALIIKKHRKRTRVPIVALLRAECCKVFQTKELGIYNILMY